MEKAEINHRASVLHTEIKGLPYSRWTTAQSDELLALLEALSPAIHTQCKNRLEYGGFQSHIDDICHEVSQKIIAEFHKFKGESQFTSWVFRITANEINGFLRKEMRNPIASFSRLGYNDGNSFDHSDDSHYSAGERVTDPSKIVQIQEERGIQQEILNQFLASESPENAAVFRSRRQGTDYATIASSLGIEPSSVKGKLHRTKIKMAAQVTEECEKRGVDVPTSFER